MSYKNRDSYQLMEYTCQACGIVELIWNSRDDVSPFAVCCAKCPGTMQHTHWTLDRQLPNYIVPVGERYFTDCTPEKAAEYAVKRIAAFNGTEYECLETSTEYPELLASLVEDFLKGMDLVVKQ